MQTAYQVQVSTDLDALTAGAADTWDSGQVTSPDNAQVRYTGLELASETRYHWRVRVWDEAGVASAWSEPTWFETGIADEDYACLATSPQVRVVNVRNGLFRLADCGAHLRKPRFIIANMRISRWLKFNKSVLENS